MIIASNHRATRRARIAVWMNLALFMIGLLGIVWGLTYLAHRPLARMQVDATNTRAYSLSDHSKTLLARLEGEWLLALVCVRDEIDPAAYRQVREVLNRYDEASAALRVEVIDPTDPDNLRRYEELIHRLRSTYGVEVDAYEHHIEQGIVAYEQAIAVAQQEAARLARLIQPLNQGGPLHRMLERDRSGFSVLANNGGAVVDAIRRTMEVTQTRPIPDYEFARDTLVAALDGAASHLATLSREYESRLASRSGTPIEVQAYFAERRVQFEAMSIDLQRRMDALFHLRPLELARIGRELERGEAAVICGPRRATVIPAVQLLPRSNLRTTQQGGIAFDQRFRGEQVLSSAIRSMVVERMPMVVFVHAQPDSLLKPRANGQDVSSLARALEHGRYVVREWSIALDPQPVAEPGQPTVWVILPPPLTERAARMTFETLREERVLMETAGALLADGAAVLLPFYPSVLQHRFQQADPWPGLVESMGLEVDTARVLTTRMVDAQARERMMQSVDMIESPLEHVIAMAVDGQQIHLPLPVVISPKADSEDAGSPSLRFEPLLRLSPSRDLWLDPEWTRTPGSAREVPDEWRVREPQALAWAVTRPSQRAGTMQRIILIGSVDWMFSPVVDAAIQLDDLRAIPVYPGNLELMQASVAWLAGMDDLIARSPTAQQVARIDGLSTAARNAWRWVIILGMPMLCLILGASVWVARQI